MKYMEQMEKTKGKAKAIDIMKLKEYVSDWVGEDMEHRVVFAIFAENDGEMWNATCDIEGDMLSLVEVSAILASESDDLKKIVHLMIGGIELMEEQSEIMGN